ncbi:RimK/LysX family protein [Endozoicomonas sp. ONNA2]|uniref:putative ATP-dependent zinc protease n=1 Tax=Endozoicomonas sp. ONNA2 TaxID=2828741 RepID=UPI0021489412|nr:RimK/LysX family protein [Endozoicomonas sp. ONNA2]
MQFSANFPGLPAVAALALLFISNAYSRAETTQTQQKCRMGDRYLFGLQERIDQIDEFPTQINALIDSGSTLSSMDARDIKIRKHANGTLWVHFAVPTSVNQQEMVKMAKPLKRYARVQTHSGIPQKRPVIEAIIRLGPVETRTDFSLTTRSRFKHQVLLGTNTLRNLAVIDLSQEFLLKKHCLRISHQP